MEPEFERTEAEGFGFGVVARRNPLPWVLLGVTFFAFSAVTLFQYRKGEAAETQLVASLEAREKAQSRAQRAEQQLETLTLTKEAVEVQLRALKSESDKLLEQNKALTAARVAAEANKPAHSRAAGNSKNKSNAKKKRK